VRRPFGCCGRQLTTGSKNLSETLIVQCRLAELCCVCPVKRRVARPLGCKGCLEFADLLHILLAGRSGSGGIVLKPKCLGNVVGGFEDLQQK